MDDMLRALPMFDNVPAEALQRLAAHGRDVHLDAGDVLFEEGANGRTCFVILTGRLEVVARRAQSDVQLQIADAGQVIGEMALLDAAPRSATVRALLASRLLELDEDAFMTLVHSNPEWSFKLLQSSTQRLRATSQHMITGLEAKNAQLQRAYDELAAAQAERIRLSRLDEELAVARRIQELFVPRTLPQPPGWELASFTRGAQAIGGDFFDCVELPSNQLGLVVADVCGKGVPAALFVALTRSLLRASTLAPGVFERHVGTTGELPGDALWFTNNYIATEHGASNMFITLFDGVLDLASGVVRYVNAGHNPPLVIGARGRLVRELETSALPLGIIEQQEFSALETTLAPGDTLVGFSDGITEAMNPNGALFGDEQFVATLRAHATLPAADLLAAIVRAVEDFSAGAPQADDMTLLIVRRKE